MKFFMNDLKDKTVVENPKLWKTKRGRGKDYRILKFKKRIRYKFIDYGTKISKKKEEANKKWINTVKKNTWFNSK